MQYFNQILTLVLESLDDPEPAVRELALFVILEMLSNQVHFPRDYCFQNSLGLFSLISSEFGSFSHSAWNEDKVSQIECLCQHFTNLDDFLESPEHSLLQVAALRSSYA